MADFYRQDLADFTRYGRLDAYELTDEELAQMLEVWRWSVARQAATPADDVRGAAQRLQRALARGHNVEVEYNTTLLLKQEAEALIHLRALLNALAALGYFLRHGTALFQAVRQQRRYRGIVPVRDPNGVPLGYPRQVLETYRAAPPDVLRRPYWRQLDPTNFEDRKRLDDWL